MKQNYQTILSLIAILFCNAVFTKNFAEPNREVLIYHNAEVLNSQKNVYELAINKKEINAFSSGITTDSLANTLINYNFNSNWAFYRGDLPNAEKQHSMIKIGLR